MRTLYKIRLFNSFSWSNTLNFQLYSSRILQIVCFSSISNKSPNKVNKSDEHDAKNPNEKQGFSPLFNEILGILGTETFSADNDEKAGALLLSSNKTQLGSDEKLSSCMQRVCGNACEKTDLERPGTLPGLDDSRVQIPGEGGLDDVSPIVHKVTQLIRAANDAVSLEERLASCSFEFNEDVVEKVLKRCFKFPHLALRFFNWVKLRKGFWHTTGTYNVMLYICGEAREFELVDELLEEMEKHFCEKNVKTWTIVMSFYGKAKMIGRALLIFDKMQKSGIEPDGTSYRIMLRALCNAGKADMALEFYKEMLHKGMNVDLALYKQLLKWLALSGDIASVLAVGNDMISVAEIPERIVYDTMLKCFCTAGRITEALELIRDLKNKNINLDADDFEVLVKGLCSVDRIADAVEMVEIMKRRNVVDAKIYEILMKASLRRNDVSEAFAYFRQMKDAGLETVSAYTNLMQHLFWKNEFEKAMKLYHEMLESGVPLDCVAVTAVAAGYARQGCISEALKVFGSMGENRIKPTPKSYTTLIRELRKVSEVDEIVKVLNQLLVSEVAFNGNILKMVLSYLEKKGERKKFDELKQMHGSAYLYSKEKESPDVNLCHAVESSKLRSEQVGQHWSDPCVTESRSFSRDDVLQVCQILSSSTDWSIVERSLEKYSFLFTQDLVLEVLHRCSLYGVVALRFFSWVEKQSGYCHSTESYNMAMKIAGRGKDFKQMRTIFYEMKRKGHVVTSDSWAIMIMQYGRTGLTDIALNNFREMKSSGCKPTKSTYKSMIMCLCGRKGRKVDEAAQIYQEMVREGCMPDKELVETFLNCLCEENKLSNAKSCIEGLQKFGFTKPLTSSLYIRALLRAGKLEEALALLNEVGDERSTVDQYTYGSLVHGLLQRGRLEEALQKIEAMKQVGIYTPVHVYTALIVHYFKLKQIDKALEMLEEMKAVGCHPTIVTYSVLICGYVRMGQVADAWKAFHRLKEKGPFPDFRTYSMFINCLCRIGKSEEAFALLSEMLDKGIVPSTVNFRTVFYGLNREGKQNLAQVVLQKKLEIKWRRIST